MPQQHPLDPETTHIIDMWFHIDEPGFSFLCSRAEDAYGNTMNTAIHVGGH